jgi:hypothetical protein
MTKATNEVGTTAARYGWELIYTGGGCEAFGKTLLQAPNEHVQVLITAAEAASIPDDLTKPCSVGFSCDSRRFEHLQDGTLNARDLLEAIAVGDALALAFQKLALGEAEGSVYAFWREQLGATPTDESLKTLPVDSECGRECAAAIATAASLLTHVRKAFGANSEHEVPLLHALLATVRCYWHG